jgi:uncharacterized membrane protein HdeD (DUF308 family)
MAFWITLVRGMLAVTLGVALVFYPDKSRPMLGNFMGMFWLVSGVISLRWGVRGERARGFPVLAGIVGVLAGAGMLGRNFTRGWGAEDVFISVLGLIILLTGLMHIFGGFRSGPDVAQPGEPRRRRSWTSLILGVFEVVLGLVLVVAPMERGPVLHFVASVWAMLGGAILIGDALSLRRLRQQQAPSGGEIDDQG